MLLLTKVVSSLFVIRICRESSSANQKQQESSQSLQIGAMINSYTTIRHQTLSNQAYQILFVLVREV
jgi:hypothetical protein